MSHINICNSFISSSRLQQSRRTSEALQSPNNQAYLAFCRGLHWFHTLLKTFLSKIRSCLFQVLLRFNSQGIKLLPLIFLSNQLSLLRDIRCSKTFFDSSILLTSFFSRRTYLYHILIKTYSMQQSFLSVFSNQLESPSKHSLALTVHPSPDSTTLWRAQEHSVTTL